MLNQGKLEKFAKDTSREAAELFSLGMSDEATIRAEIKKAILQKSKDGDDSPFDFHEVLKKASYRGQPIFSGSKLKMLENLYNASIDNEELLELSPQKKLASLAAVNSLLDLCAKKQTAGNAWKKEAAGQISKNSKIIEAALEHIALTAPDSGGSTTLEAQ
jgi:hypothetical protein